MIGLAIGLTLTWCLDHSSHITLLWWQCLCASVCTGSVLSGKFQSVNSKAAVKLSVHCVVLPYLMWIFLFYFDCVTRLVWLLVSVWLNKTERVPVAVLGADRYCMLEKRLTVKLSSGSKCTMQVTVSPWINTAASPYSRSSHVASQLLGKWKGLWQCRQQHTLLRRVAKCRWIYLFGAFLFAIILLFYAGVVKEIDFR